MEMEWNFIVRLCVAGLCGTIIGLDREYRVKDAGFRTHFLVALGSALIMIVSQYGFEDFLATHDGLRLDPSRIAAQVVSGIGFIGAGTIIIHRQQWKIMLRLRNILQLPSYRYQYQSVQIIQQQKRQESYILQ